jgi:AcrR family transcriptional regulator
MSRQSFGREHPEGDGGAGAPTSGFPPLPLGRRRLPADFVDSYQRQRMVAALIDTVDRCGPNSLTVAKIVKTAGVSRSTFYEHFRDCDDCFDFTCDEAFGVLFDPFGKAFAEPGPWAERLSAALAALLAALAKEPLLGELCLVHSPARQPDRRTYRRAVDVLAAALRGARPASAQDLPPLGEELLARGAVALIAARLAAGEGEGLEELAPQLTHLLTAPLELEGTDWPNAPAILG